MSAKMIRRGVFLIGVGSVLLLNNFALLDWEIWYGLFRFWPVILICFGLERLFREGRLSALTYLSPIILAFTFVGVIYYQGFSKEEDFADFREFDRELYRWSAEDEGGYSKVKIDIDFGVGSLWLKSGKEALVSAALDYDRDPPRCRYFKDDEVAVVKIQTESHKCSAFSRKCEHRSRIELSDKYPLDLRVDAGACELDLDLSDFELADFRLDGGVCEVDLRFGDLSEHLRASLDLGVSDVDIQIPEHVGLKLIRNAALSSFDHRGIELGKLSGSTYLSENYSKAEKTIEMYIDAGLSSLTIRSY